VATNQLLRVRMERLAARFWEYGKNNRVVAGEVKDDKGNPDPDRALSRAQTWEAAAGDVKTAVLAWADEDLSKKIRQCSATNHGHSHAKTELEYLLMDDQALLLEQKEIEACREQLQPLMEKARHQILKELVREALRLEHTSLKTRDELHNLVWRKVPGWTDVTHSYRETSLAIDALLRSDLIARETNASFLFVYGWKTKETL